MPRPGLLLLLLAPWLTAQDTLQVKPIDKGEATINGEDLHRHLSFLASDEMKGRMTGSKENEKAAAYISDLMEKHGLRPAGERKTWLQSFSAPNRVGKNVCGVLLGTSRKREYVVVGAHYDHVGLGNFGSRDSGARGQVHNGADDNASGTSSLLELVEAFGAKRTKRSILFIAFSGEELGLLGSRAWVKKPTVPLGSVITMINLDMIGRSQNDYLFVGGVNTGKGFQKLVRSTNEPFGLHLELAGGGRGPSDFRPFYDKKIPVLCLFTGEHGDYHKPGDDVELINIPVQTRITRLTYRLVRRLADAPKRPRWQKDDRNAMPLSSSRGADYAKKVLGITFDETPTQEEGLRIAELHRNGLAAKAGLRVDDVVLSLDDTRATSRLVIQSILALKQKGQTLRLRFRRGRRTATKKLVID